MSLQTTFSIRGRNPDVLTCIANLSNDEVFTPPEFANQMLDSITDMWAAANGGEDIWSNPELRFLDPFTKSGVFLREITTRLTRGLEGKIPDLETRVDHILTNQVFGIGVTELTAQLSRRSVYCSKIANGEHSIAKSFSRPEGNIWFERTEHTWSGGSAGILVANDEGESINQTIGAKCTKCGATQASLDRGIALETHAYALLHTDDAAQFIREIFGDDMQFDVIIGNPPYQLEDGGFGASAAPIYNKFVDKAKALDPRMLCMVIPARWFAGGKGLDDFREEMLSDTRIRVVEDYPDASEVFPGVSIKGGVCYFLWDRDNAGDCTVRTHNQALSSAPIVRPLLEPGADVFIRFNEALPILKKVTSFHSGAGAKTLLLSPDQAFQSIVSSRKHFGLATNFRGKSSQDEGDVLIYQNGGTAYYPRKSVAKNPQDIDAWKVFIPIAGSGSNVFPDPVLGKPFIGAPGTISTETYNLVGPFASETEAANAMTYMTTRFMRFLVLLHKPTQHTAKGVYAFVPMQDFTKEISDELLYEKYDINEDEKLFIESLIRSMDLKSGDN
jgi:site-specific DNA-methyltransferase (adenine-specific)